MTTRVLRVPADIPVGHLIQTEYGNYTVASDKTVTVDVRLTSALLTVGYALPLGTGLAANGLPASRLRLLDAFCQDGAPLAAATAAGDFGLTCTPGTAMYLIGEAAQNNTKTDKALWEFVLPDTYVAGQDLTLTVNADYDGTGVAGTKTIDASVYEQAAVGTGTTDLCATAAQTLTATAASYVFIITGTNLVPGDVVLIVVTVALEETGNLATLTARINSASLS